MRCMSPKRMLVWAAKRNAPSVMRRLCVQSAAQTLRSQDARVARGRGRASFRKRRLLQAGWREEKLTIQFDLCEQAKKVTSTGSRRRGTVGEAQEGGKRLLADPVQTEGREGGKGKSPNTPNGPADGLLLLGAPDGPDEVQQEPECSKVLIDLGNTGLHSMGERTPPLPHQV